MIERGLLEVIALDPLDAELAQAGGADRIELTANMAADGLTPSRSIVRSVLAATDLPVRVMLRDVAGFAPGDMTRLRATARELLEDGVREFVFGFLTDNGHVDAVSVGSLSAELGDASWTFHRALDHAADISEAHSVLAGLGCDTVLTAGHPEGVAKGLPALRIFAERSGPALMVGGGLKPGQIPELCAAGVRAFHAGSGVRSHGWSGQVDPEAVRTLAELINREAGAVAGT